MTYDFISDLRKNNQEIKKGGNTYTQELYVLDGSCLS